MSTRTAELVSIQTDSTLLNSTKKINGVKRLGFQFSHPKTRMLYNLLILHTLNFNENCFLMYTLLSQFHPEPQAWINKTLYITRLAG